MTPGGTAAFHTLGCKLNFSETSTIARDLSEAGYARVGIGLLGDAARVDDYHIWCVIDANARITGFAQPRGFCGRHRMLRPIEAQRDQRN